MKASAIAVLTLTATLTATIFVNAANAVSLPAAATEEPNATLSPETIRRFNDCISAIRRFESYRFTQSEKKDVDESIERGFPRCVRREFHSEDGTPYSHITQLRFDR